MSGRTEARRASFRIRVIRKIDLKLVPDDEQSPQDPTRKLGENQIELNEAPETDSSIRKDKGLKKTQNGVEVNRRCSACDRIVKVMRRGMCQICYQRLHLRPLKRLDKRICTKCKQLKSRYAKGMCGSCYKHITRKMIECTSCGETKKHAAHGLVKCRSCGKIKKHNAHGLCKKCYNREYTPSKMLDCRLCGETKTHEARGLCKKCYRKEKPKVKCQTCGEIKIPVAHGLCAACYKREHPNRKKVQCTSCGQTKRHAAHGLCKECYSRAGGKSSECTSCGQMKIHHARGLCKTCYSRAKYKNKANNGKKSTRAGPSSNAAAQGTSNDDAITLSSASENETDAVVSSGEEGENYDVKQRVKKEEPVLSSGDEANLKREVDSSSSDDDEEDGYSEVAIKSEVKQEP